MTFWPRVGRPLMLALAVVAAISIGCSKSDRDFAGFRFTNKTAEPLSVVYVAPNGVESDEPIVHVVRPGESIVTTDKFRVDICVEGTLIARAVSGAEVARRAEPICQPGEWVIEAPT